MPAKTERHTQAAKKQPKPAPAVRGIDVLATLVDEIAEAVELMRPYFPDDDDALRHRAIALRAERYRAGHWPDFELVAKAEAAEATAAAEAARGAAEVTQSTATESAPTE